MKNLDKVAPYASSVAQGDWGTVTTLLAETAISAKDSISFAEKTLLANYVYEKNGTYKLIYTTVAMDGSSESYVEDDGILPTLFLSPDQKNYVSVIPYHPDKELEISIPVFHREDVELPKGNRPFTGNFIGTTDSHSIFHDVDFNDKKPDKILAIEFINGTLKKKHNVKIPLPANNRIAICSKAIHLLANDGSILLHREIDEKGDVVRYREIDANDIHVWQILSACFDSDSYLLAQEQDKIIVKKIGADGASDIIELADFADPLFNTWQPVNIADGTVVTRFNTEFGNGWLTTKNDELLEIFYSKGVQGYRNLLTNEVLQIPHDNLIISSINKTMEHAYAVVLYPMADDTADNAELIVLNRHLP
ncbi:hypothetical protein IGS59_25745 [Janthinobacterium sp. GW460P]|uniref:hypothetical protein n=1 Tax=unclassified Janthinobacterium TaxID=2610881 RepID=UPI000A3214DE|nr:MULTISPECIES: hypothetical protein [unclassified Janthinobacterium]MCC7705650.1 hypothetical protein [Janthinobacterium sp. GW460P]MCC7711186.1 hypothetical protein [Janthinobacterium sp. GW460W]